MWCPSHRGQVGGQLALHKEQCHLGLQPAQLQKAAGPQLPAAGPQLLATWHAEISGLCCWCLTCVVLQNPVELTRGGCKRACAQVMLRIKGTFSIGIRQEMGGLLTHSSQPCM
ncbi:unnamed protein product [Symbiodinium natans]|uniref:Uncharacterized protein n=1 Tax=Symbiodinium natans TaxID=878477 RepID=A0A812PD55_9DINO|nr:unnamed protein product [Symbiodinium natans]